MDSFQIADLRVDMECSGEILRKQGRPYRLEPFRPVDITIQIPEEKLAGAREKNPHLTPDECEYILTGFEFARSLLDFDGFCLHASAVALENRAVLFSAPCGTGKSTHAALWQQYFGQDKAVILNDDKPALRLAEGVFQVYGTPWSGKTDLNTNTRAPLQAVVFLEQAAANRVRRLTSREAVRLLVYQSLRPGGDPVRMERLLELLDALLRRIPVYHLECTASIEAVKIVFEAIREDGR